MAGFIPALAGALIIFIAGYIVAKIVQKMATVILRRLSLDVASERVGLKYTLARAEIHLSVSQIVGKIVFWVIMLTFLIPAAETLGLERVSETIGALIAYLPNVIGAALIVVVGMVVARFIQDLVRSGAESINLEYADAVGKFAYVVLLVIIAGLAIGQLRVETALLNRVIEIIIIAAGATLAIGLGFGSRQVAQNLIAGFYVRERHKQGTAVKLGDQEGVLEVVGSVSTRIRTKDGQSVFLPNSQLIENVVRSNN